MNTHIAFCNMGIFFRNVLLENGIHYEEKGKLDKKVST